MMAEMTLGGWRRARPPWLHTVRRLALRDWLALAEAAVCLAVAALALRVAPQAVLRQAQAGALRPVQGGSTLAWGEAARLWRLASALMRRLPRRPTCLAQALAVGWMLRRRGIATTLRFGVRVADGAFAAHAWLECAGRIVGPAHVTETFTPLEPVAALTSLRRASPPSE